MECPLYWGEMVVLVLDVSPVLDALSGDGLRNLLGYEAGEEVPCKELSLLGRLARIKGPGMGDGVVGERSLEAESFETS